MIDCHDGGVALPLFKMKTQGTVNPCFKGLTCTFGAFGRSVRRGTSVGAKLVGMSAIGWGDGTVHMVGTFACGR